MVTYYQVGMLAMVCQNGAVELVSSQKQSQPLRRWTAMTGADKTYIALE